MKRKQSSKSWFIVGTLVFLIALYLFYLQDSAPNNSVSPTLFISPTEVLPANTPNTSLDWFEVYFTDPKIPFNKVVTGGIEEVLINKINNASTSIDAAVFEFDLDNVAQALIDAKNRGVEVRLVYDSEYTDVDPQMQTMKTSGISAVPDNRSAYMHNKFFIVDGECVWTGSFNLTVNAAYKNNENAFYLCTPEMVQNYEAEFLEMYSGQFGSTSPSETPYVEFYVGDVLIENYFAPEDEVMDRVVELVSAAKSSIHFMAYSFTDDTLGQAMIEKNHNGVDVQGIFESKGASTDSSECGKLFGNDIAVTLDGNPATFHHKVIIIDGEIVIFGSFNFTANANESNDENLLIVHDYDLAQEFEKEYQKMLSLSKQPVNGVCRSK